MKDINLLIWLTQLGLSVALPIIGFLFLGLWLQEVFAIGRWFFWLMLALGLLSAAHGFRSSLQAMKFMSRNKKSEEPPSVSFNDHL